MTTLDDIADFEMKYPEYVTPLPGYSIIWIPKHPMEEGRVYLCEDVYAPK